MPNGIAYLALLAWPLACLVLFRTQKLERALIWSILGGYLFLPPIAEFNLPLVPAMDKVSIPNLSVLLILMFAMKQRVNLWPQSIAARWLVVGLVLSAIPTVLTNGDPITFEVLRNADPIVFLVDQLPGQSVRDIGSVLIAQMLTLVPFLLARQFLSSEDGLKELLLAFMVGGLVYSVPSLIEIRFSPQINTTVYGFFQHSFAQTMRGGGFRPIVFLPHSLWLALFVCISLISAAALMRASDVMNRRKMIAAVAYLLVLLILCKSAASIAYGLVLLPLVLFAPMHWQIKLAAFMGTVAVAYPILRNAGVLPLDALVTWIDTFNPDRAHSLGFRFNNEEQLLQRAAEKPLFGWGGWGRNLIRHDETGQILSIPDGRWIIVFGTFGWLGYICEFGLLALPLVLMLISLRRMRDKALSPWVAPLTLILSVTMMDMLLNATLTPLTWLTAGAILGHVEKRMPREIKHRHAMRATPALSPNQTGRGGKRTIL